MDVKINGGTIPQKELEQLVEQVKSNNPDKVIKDITFTVDGEFVDVSYNYDSVPFDRIRRITGYLVGTIDRFNDAKRAEVEDRVKHSLSCSCGDLETI